ncbi:MAG: hypothetical protein H7Z42_00245, partial [Roseiflexaceae bacterium]|nr:hypothetical protein [Roseiflexaceae bacterium]
MAAFSQIVRRGRVALLVLAVLLAALTPSVAAAHPLGNFTINRFSRLALQGEQVGLRYIVDMAEIPALQERQQIDADQNGDLSQSEQESYRDTTARTLAANLSLRMGEQLVTLNIDTAALFFPPGQGGLPTLRLELELRGALPANGGAASFRDDNFADRIGWSEVVVVGDTGVAISESSAPAQGISDELRSYPEDLLQTPSSINTASFQWSAAPGGSLSTTSSPISTSYPQVEQQTDNLASLVAVPLSSPWGLLLALATALGLGAAHALAPGHGKTIVAAYLVGTRGTAWHALFLGLITTITHTAGVFALGLLTLFVSQYVLPEQFYPWLSALSGVMVALIGAGLLRQRLANVRGHQH